MTARPSIAFVLPNLSGGGAARVASILCAEWVAMGLSVHLITYEHPGAPSAYPLHPNIVRHQLGMSVSPKGVVGFLHNNLRRVVRLRSLLRRLRPSAAISFLFEANVVLVLASKGLGVPTLIGERNHPAEHRVSRAKRAIRRQIYPLATRLCVQTEDIADWFKTNLGIDAAVIPNPVSQPGPAQTHSEPLTRRVAVSLGRLEAQKGHDRLIAAFAKIADRVRDWDLAVYGEGSLRSGLEKQISSYDLADRVRLPGETSAPLIVLQRSDLYVHSARYEGFPNAVLEAMSAGLCVVAFDSPGGTRQILADGAAGILVDNDNVDALAGAMLKAMSDEDLRRSFASIAQEASRKFAPDAIAARWLSEMEQARHTILRFRGPL